MIAEGKTIKLRWMKLKDLSFLVAVRNTGRSFLHDSREFDVKNAIKWWHKTCPRFAIIELLDGTPVGYIRTSDWDYKHRRVMIGADIHPDHRRQGYAFEAYELFLNHLFLPGGYNKVSLEVLSINQGAITLYEKLGFIREGVKREEILRDGKYLDSIIMSILRSEFEDGT